VNCCEVIDMRFLCICMDCWIDCLRVMNMHCHGFLGGCRSCMSEPAIIGLVHPRS